MKTLEEIQQALDELKNSTIENKAPETELNQDELVNLIPNFLDGSTIDSIIKKYEASKDKASFRINHYGFWGKGLAKGSFGPVYMLPLDEYAETIQERVWKNLPQFEGYYPYSLFLHVWEPGSQINWHDDIHNSEWEELTTTIYLNKNWSPDWGGLFLYSGTPGLVNGKWVCPVHNQLCWFVPPVWHATTMCSNSMTEPRLSIQGFWRKSDKPILTAN
jgi:Rps23 Pro-64 3,4-dihydroxylase Tpa1-like proline 4-hydroxylase